MISHSSPQASAQPGCPASANATVPATVQTTPHTLSQNRIRSALRAVVGSLPVRITLTTPGCDLRLHGSECPETERFTARTEPGAHSVG
ncbi:hypothetical protein GCM10017779_47510 [Streptomyces capillispiralis]|nr:hypothetical protein GCM10017779_47510 [Streptomyces capillispiralis]